MRTQIPPTPAPLTLLGSQEGHTLLTRQCSCGHGAYVVAPLSRSSYDTQIPLACYILA
ncbi:hypothetical protein HanRHA438_Chr01g0000821 [Helianthus annuus]|nr:hypothetical protein HanRHA438_Chr01g0000821 [Helianthus annuus]